VTLWRHGYDSPTNAIFPVGNQLIEKKSISSDSRTPAIGQASQIVAERCKFITPDSGPLSGCPGAPEMLILPTFLQIADGFSLMFGIAKIRRQRQSRSQ
jgi:hypothetical protein